MAPRRMDQMATGSQTPRRPVEAVLRRAFTQAASRSPEAGELVPVVEQGTTRHDHLDRYSHRPAPGACIGIGRVGMDHRRLGSHLASAACASSGFNRPLPLAMDHSPLAGRRAAEATSLVAKGLESFSQSETRCFAAQSCAVTCAPPHWAYRSGYSSAYLGDRRANQTLGHFKGKSQKSMGNHQNPCRECRDRKSTRLNSSHVK